MNRRRIITSSLLAVLAIAGLATMFAASPAQALPSNEVETLYLDANGAVVGSSFRACSGQRYREGVTTDKTITYVASCVPQPLATLTCRWSGSTYSCAAAMFIDACVPHFGEALCLPFP